MKSNAENVTETETQTEAPSPISVGNPPVNATNAPPAPGARPLNAPFMYQLDEPPPPFHNVNQPAPPQPRYPDDPYKRPYINFPPEAPWTKVPQQPPYSNVPQQPPYSNVPQQQHYSMAPPPQQAPFNSNVPQQQPYNNAPQHPTAPRHGPAHVWHPQQQQPAPNNYNYNNNNNNAPPAWQTRPQHQQQNYYPGQSRSQWALERIVQDLHNQITERDQKTISDLQQQVANFQRGGAQGRQIIDLTIKQEKGCSPPLPPRKHNRRRPLPKSIGNERLPLKQSRHTDDGRKQSDTERDHDYGDDCSDDYDDDYGDDCGDDYHPTPQGSYYEPSIDEIMNHAIASRRSVLCFFEEGELFNKSWSGFIGRSVRFNDIWEKIQPDKNKDVGKLLVVYQSGKFAHFISGVEDSPYTMQSLIAISSLGDSVQFLTRRKYEALANRFIANVRKFPQRWIPGTGFTHGKGAKKRFQPMTFRFNEKEVRKNMLWNHLRKIIPTGFSMLIYQYARKDHYYRLHNPESKDDAVIECIPGEQLAQNVSQRDFMAFVLYGAHRDYDQNTTLTPGYWRWLCAEQPVKQLQMLMKAPKHPFDDGAELPTHYAHYVRFLDGHCTASNDDVKGRPQPLPHPHKLQTIDAEGTIISNEAADKQPISFCKTKPQSSSQSSTNSDVVVLSDATMQEKKNDDDNENDNDDQPTDNMMDENDNDDSTMTRIGDKVEAKENEDVKENDKENEDEDVKEKENEDDKEKEKEKENGDEKENEKEKENEIQNESEKKKEKNKEAGAQKQEGKKKDDGKEKEKKDSE